MHRQLQDPQSCIHPLSETPGIICKTLVRNRSPPSRYVISRRALLGQGSRPLIVEDTRLCAICDIPSASTIEIKTFSRAGETVGSGSVDSFGLVEADNKLWVAAGGFDVDGENISLFSVLHP
jgi:hypothetical protein